MDVYSEIANELGDLKTYTVVNGNYRMDEMFCIFISYKCQKELLTGIGLVYDFHVSTIFGIPCELINPASKVLNGKKFVILKRTELV